MKYYSTHIINFVENILNKDNIKLKDVNIVEIGSNTGHISVILSKYCNSWIGYETNSVFLTFLQNNEYLNKCIFNEGFIDNVEDNTVEFLICNNIMKYSDPTMMWYNIDRVLKTNGILWIIDNENYRLKCKPTKLWENVKLYNIIKIKELNILNLTTNYIYKKLD